MKFSLKRKLFRDASVRVNSKYPPIDLRGFEARPKALIRAVDSYLHKYGADVETRSSAEALLKATDFDWMLPVATSLVNRFRGETSC